MKSKTISYKGLYVTLCDCDCHSQNVRHIVPCCDLTYCNYITEDNKLDQDLLQAALERNHQWRLANWTAERLAAVKVPPTPIE